MGFIAQEVEQVFPHWVATDPDGYKKINMEHLDSLLVNAIKEQQAQIEKLQTQVAALEKQATRVGMLEKENAEMRGTIIAMQKQMEVNAEQTQERKTNYEKHN